MKSNHLQKSELKCLDNFSDRLTLIYMGYFDYLFYIGGQKAPPV